MQGSAEVKQYAVRCPNPSCLIVQFRKPGRRICIRCHEPLDPPASTGAPTRIAIMKRAGRTQAPAESRALMGKLLREAREEKGMKQRDVARKMPCVRTYMTKVERGRVLPNIPTLLKLCAAIGVATAEIIEGWAEDSRDRQGQESWELQMARELANMRENEQRIVIRAICIMARADQLPITDYMQV